MKDIAFRAVQGVFWCLIITGWAQVCRAKPTSTSLRQRFSQGSLLCASLSLLFTTAITIYIRVGQQKPYDDWESAYLVFTTFLSVLGLALGTIGKAAPRLIGFSTSFFTLLLVLMDGISI